MTDRTPESVLIMGNVGVGKSSLFDHLCDRPSIENQEDLVRQGRLKGGLFTSSETPIFDPPGIHTIFARGEDNLVSQSLLLNREVSTILMVLDATNLRRSLLLALQLSELEIPICFVLNMMDEAESRGIEISVQALERLLGTGVRWTVLTEDQGLDEIPALLKKATIPRKQVTFPARIEEALEKLQGLLAETTAPARALGVMLLGGSKLAAHLDEQELGEETIREVSDIVSALRRKLNRPLDVVLTESYSESAERIVSEVQRVHQRSPRLLMKVGRWAQQPSTGIPIALAILSAMYMFVGTIGATMLVDLLNARVFSGILIPWLKEMVQWIPWEFVRAALVDDNFGVLTTGLFLAFGIVLPVLFCFYLFFGFIEESGYLPRFSVLLNRVMHRIGLTGKGIIPLVLGFSCITMALLTVRILDSKKERLIATFLLILGLPCAPLLAVMMVILGPMPSFAAVFIFGFIGLQILVAGVLANKILPGAHADLILELPPMRMPSARTVFVRTLRRTSLFMKEAVPIFLVASFAVFLFDRVGGLAALEAGTRPLMEGLLGLPEESVRVFIKTMIRRENGATELALLKDNFTNLQLVVTLLLMTFLMPCINSIIVIFKERGTRDALIILGAVFTYALVAAGLVNHGCRLLGVTF